MQASPKKPLLELDRVINRGNFLAESLDRDEFLQMNRNKNLEGFPEEVMQDIREIITSDFLTAYPEVDPLYRKLAECLNVGKEQIITMKARPY